MMGQRPCAGHGPGWRGPRQRHRTGGQVLRYIEAAVEAFALDVRLGCPDRIDLSFQPQFAALARDLAAPAPAGTPTHPAPPPPATTRT